MKEQQKILQKTQTEKCGTRNPKLTHRGMVAWRRWDARVKLRPREGRAGHIAQGAMAHEDVATERQDKG